MPIKSNDELISAIISGIDMCVSASLTNREQREQFIAELKSNRGTGEEPQGNSAEKSS